MDTASSRPSSPPRGPMPRSRAKAIHQEVNSLLSTLTLNSPLDGMLPHANMLCVIRYEPREKYVAGDTKLDTEDGEEEYQLKDAPQGRHCRPPGTGTAGLLTPALPASRRRHCRPAHPGTAGLQTPALPAPPAEGATKAKTGTAGPGPAALPAPLALPAPAHRHYRPNPC